MKNIYKLFALFLVVTMVFNACEEENDYVPPFNEVSSLTWWSTPGINTDTTSNEPIYSSTEKTIGVDKFIAFYDLSRGVVSHEWKIPATTKLLSKTISETDSVYTKYIIPNAGSSTTDKHANVLFTEKGVYEILLVNTFNEEVSESVNENGVWKVNKKFTITVD
ncbi:hypothetical protein [Polaribacter sp. Z022]|uniref:hypothetical protein n=1 Tax=Polaribacter sp. Z022 TaxID=2927125 RepID=UPI002020BDFB|nr:hypothetical protein [Polaribacter sp. Z022]MCL7754612.1 hypothetical protein [Polaribacter sp. Z022]